MFSSLANRSATSPLNYLVIAPTTAFVDIKNDESLSALILVHFDYGSVPEMILRTSSTLAAQHCGNSKLASRSLRGKGPLLTLDHVGNFLPSSRSKAQINDEYQFLQKKRVLALWRDIVRVLNSMRASPFIFPPSVAHKTKEFHLQQRARSFENMPEGNLSGIGMLPIS